MCLHGSSFHLRPFIPCFKLAALRWEARLAKKMTQSSLATAINEKAGVINEYESGKAGGPLMALSC